MTLMRFKKISCTILFFLLASAFVFAESPLSTHYIIPNSLNENGGTINAKSADKIAKFQEISLVSGTSTSTRYQIIHGMHFSGIISQIDGYTDYVADTISINATATGSIITKVEFLANINNSEPIHLGYDDLDIDSLINGWQIAWNTLDNVTVTAQVTLLARAYDGFSWGDLKTIETPFYVDNEIPQITSLTAAYAAFSPNNSPGIKDYNTVSFNIQESFGSVWDVQIKSADNTVVREFNHTYDRTGIYSIVWDGKDEYGAYVSDGVYTYTVTAFDKVGHSTTRSGTFIVDNTPPVFSSAVLTAQGMDINSQKGSLIANWSATDPLDPKLSYDLYYAAAPYAYSDKSVDQSASTAWSITNVNDTTYYKAKIIAYDAAGNSTSQETNIAFTPDRTAPVISDNLTSVTGIEAIDWSVNLASNKSDNYFSGNDLKWSKYEYTYAEDHTKSQTRQLFNSISINGDIVTFNLMPYANTDGTIPYNRYGYPGATFKLHLEDASGNYTERDIVCNVANVNNRPVIQNMIKDTNPGSNGITYHFYLLKNTPSTAVNLDNFVDDVDTPTSSLTWVASANAYITPTIGTATDHHPLVFTPKAYWYGDTIVSINVTDGEPVPTNSYDTQAIKIRVWPSNTAPIISDSLPKTYNADEDTQITINLHAYKSDAPGEDDLDQLKWSVASYDSAFIASISGENNPTDLITFKPVAYKYGTTTVILKLSDTDTNPTLIFPNYMPNPKSVTVSITLTWNPVNNPPVIGDIPTQTKNENSTSWTLDLAPYKSDIEDAGADLKWQVLCDNANFLTISTSNDLVTFTPITNAWGTSNVTFILTDSDTHINFPGYVPNPLSTTKKIVFTLMAINNIPSIATINFTADNALHNNHIRNGDTFTVTAIGYSDVGYTNDARDTAAIGDEYGPANIPALNHIQNQKLYNYVWKIDGTTIQTTTSTSTETNQFTATQNYDGKVLTVEAYPNDGIDIGNLKTASFTFNSRPSLAVLNTPTNVFFVTRNITISWNVATDPDNDTIYYRVITWKVANASDPTPSVTSTSNIYWDSGWRESYTKVDSADASFSGGYYYWAVFTGNKFNDLSSGYDYYLPTDIRKFQVMSAMPPMSDLIGTSEILPSRDIQLGGRYQVLYGNKPAYTAIWLEMSNTKKINNTEVSQYSFTEIVSANANQTWAYIVEYPEGRTTYNIYLKDIAGNYSMSYQFVITDDITPPPPPTISGPGLTLNGSRWVAVCNASYYTISGTKEAGSAIYFNDGNKKTQVVAFTDDSTFSFPIRSDRPSGNLTAKDRALNESSPVVPVSITFIMGIPSLNISLSRDIVNSNPNTPLLSDSAKTELNKSVVTWSCNRDIGSYSFVKLSDSSVLLSGGAVSAGTTINSTIMAGSLALGDNSIALNVVDIAANNGTISFGISRDEVAPSINTTSWFNKNGKAYITGRLENTESIFINNSTANVIISAGNWFYQNNSFPFSSTDIVITARDSAYNQFTKTEWDHSKYSDLLSAGILAQIVEAPNLPDNILSLKSMQISKFTSQSYGLTTESKTALMNGKTEKPEIVLTPELSNSDYWVYGKKFDGTIIQEVNLIGFDTKLHIPYEDNVKIDQSKLIIVYFNSEKGVWENPELNQNIDKDNKIVTAIIPKTGIWGLAEYRPFAVDFKSVRIYPNPWKPNSGVTNTGDTSGISFDQLPANTHIRLYTISGQLIREESSPGSIWTWDGTNQSGKDVASGVYLYILTSGSNVKKGKLTIIR